MSCKEEDFITPNDYCDFFDILEAPSDFNYLLIYMLKRKPNTIQEPEPKRTKEPQPQPIDTIDNNKITNSNHDNIKIGHVTLSKASNSNGNQKDIFMNKKTLQLSPITYQNLLYIGYLYRGLYC